MSNHPRTTYLVRGRKSPDAFLGDPACDRLFIIFPCTQRADEMLRSLGVEIVDAWEAVETPE
jgi:hypothetical protein